MRGGMSNAVWPVAVCSRGQRLGVLRVLHLQTPDTGLDLGRVKGDDVAVGVGHCGRTDGDRRGLARHKTVGRSGDGGGHDGEDGEDGELHLDCVVVRNG